MCTLYFALKACRTKRILPKGEHCSLNRWLVWNFSGNGDCCAFYPHDMFCVSDTGFVLSKKITF